MDRVILILLAVALSILSLIILIFALNWYLNKNVSYTNNLSDKKALIVYYSHSNNTEEVAKMMKQYLNCDIEKITTEEYENKSAVELTNLVVEQMKSNYLPQINKIDISNYDVIFVGSPVWKDDIALPVKSFLVNNDFKNKTIIPFYTFGGFVNKSKSDNRIKDLSHNDNVLQSFLTIYCPFAFVKYRLVKWLNEVTLN